jgi:shikimate dehydrogenase
MIVYGLIGYPLGHSFSQRYFTEKFAREGIAGTVYELFPLPRIEALPDLLERRPDLRGFNVTIPYKEAVKPYLHRLDESAEAIGAVNTVAIRGGRLTGYNTDGYGFEQSLRSWLDAHAAEPAPGPLRALVLGTGGAAKAAAWALRRLQVPFQFVSRRPDGPGQVGYDDLPGLLDARPGRWLWVNATPLGTFPATDGAPNIPFDRITTEHLVYDLVYNPAETVLLRRARENGASVMNGLEMLYLQAEKAWEIWQESSKRPYDE